MFRNICIETTHTDLTKQPPTVGMQRVQAVYYVCANFHPFTVITDFSTLRHPLAPLPLSHPSRSLFSFLAAHTHSSRFLLHLSPTTTTASAYIATNLPRPSFFAILFAPSLSSLLPLFPPLPSTNRDGGDGGGCPEGVAISIEGRSRQFSYRTT